MLWTLAFDRLGAAVSDIYFVDPALDQGEGGAERGVRLELRQFVRDELNGSVYSAAPIRIDLPIWRVDLLETVESVPGSLNRAHHHPRFRGWEPGRRQFVEELSANPVPWLRERFADIDKVLIEAEVEADEQDIEALRNAGPMIVGQVEFMLGEVAAGRAALAPQERADFVRHSWL